MFLERRSLDVNIHASFTQHLQLFWRQKPYTPFGRAVLLYGMALALSLTDYAALAFYSGNGMEQIKAFKARLGLPLIPAVGCTTTGCSAQCHCGQVRREENVHDHGRDHRD